MVKAILAMVKFLGERRWKIRLEEAEELAKAKSYQVIEEAIQTRERPDSATFFGKGKINEIKEKVEEVEADVIIVYNDLTSKQKLNIERIVKRRVIDKYDLILKLFEEHAHDAVSNLQIKLARISRQIPYIRLATSKIHMGEKPFTRAGGEIPWQKKIADLRGRKKKLEEKLEKRKKDKLRRIQSRKELGFINGCLVGYYNAGKTSIFNWLSEADKPVNSRPFTTVQGKVSKIKDKLLLTDTIGFVKDIEPGIIDSFRINMEDIKHSDFLIFTVDISLPLSHLNARTRATVRILEDLEVWEKTKLILANKVDKADDRSLADKLEVLKILTKRQAPIVTCSANKGTGMNEVERRIEAIGQRFTKQPITIWE